MALAAPWRRPAGSGSTAPPGRNLFDRLPDELLLNVLSKVPRTGVVLADGALQIDWRSVERVCRRWRRLALQHLPARLVIQLNDCGPEWDWEQLAEDFEELLPHVAARSVADCWIHADAAATPPELPAQLAAAVFPSVRK